MRHLLPWLVVASMSVVTAACFRGAEREKEAPPGLPGGRCLAPDGTCSDGACNRDDNYCFNPNDPCEGFFCGGSERGECVLDNRNQPNCECAAGFEDETFAFYCCPDGDALSDPVCAAAQGRSQGDGESGASSSSEADTGTGA